MSCLTERPLPPAAGQFASGNVSVREYGRFQVQAVCSDHTKPSYTRTSTTTLTSTSTQGRDGTCSVAPSCYNQCGTGRPQNICPPLGHYWDGNRLFHRTHSYREQCYCDDNCKLYHDCCLDYDDHCPFTTVSTESTDYQSSSAQYTTGSTSILTTTSKSTTSTSTSMLASTTYSATTMTETTTTISETTTSETTTRTSSTTSTALDETNYPTQSPTMVPQETTDAPGQPCGQHFHCGQQGFCSNATEIDGKGKSNRCLDCYFCDGSISIDGYCPRKCRSATSTTVTTTSTSTTTVSTTTAAWCWEGTISNSLASNGAIVCCPAYCTSCTGPTKDDDQSCELNAIGVPLYPDSFNCCMFAHLETTFNRRPRMCRSGNDVSCVM